MRFAKVIALVTALGVAQAAAPDLSEKFFNDGAQVIVFFGDSITANGGYINAFKALLLKRFPKMQAVIVNRGKSSETLAGLTEGDHPGPRPVLFTRLADELATHKPTLVFACYGMNDGIYHPYGEERASAYRAGVAKLLAEVGKTGAPVILLTPPPFDSVGGKAKIKDAPPYGYKTPYRNYDSTLAAYGHWLQTLRTKDQLVVDIHDYVKAMDAAQRKANPSFTLTTDGIHPGAQGHQWMAEALEKGLFDPPTAVAPATVPAARPGAAATRPVDALGRALRPAYRPAGPALPRSVP